MVTSIFEACKQVLITYDNYNKYRDLLVFTVFTHHSRISSTSYTISFYMVKLLGYGRKDSRRAGMRLADLTCFGIGPGIFFTRQALGARGDKGLLFGLMLPLIAPRIYIGDGSFSRNYCIYKHYMYIYIYIIVFVYYVDIYIYISRYIDDFDICTLFKRYIDLVTWKICLNRQRPATPMWPAVPTASPGSSSSTTTRDRCTSLECPPTSHVFSWCPAPRRCLLTPWCPSWCSS